MSDQVVRVVLALAIAAVILSTPARAVPESQCRALVERIERVALMRSRGVTLARYIEYIDNRESGPRVYAIDHAIIRSVYAADSLDAIQGEIMSRCRDAPEVGAFLVWLTNSTGADTWSLWRYEP